MLNLMPWREELLKKQKMHLIKWFSAELLVSTILFLGWHMFIDHKFKAAVSVNAMLSKKLMGVNQLHKNWRHKVSQASGVWANYLLYVKQREAISILKAVCSFLPNNSCMTSIKYDSKSLLFEGVLLSSTSESIKKFVVNLQKATLKKVQLLRVSSEGAQKKIFQILIQMNKDGENH